MRFATLFALLALSLAYELSPVDNVRKKFYSLEEDLWRNVTDPLWRDSGLGGDVELTKAFVVLDNQIAMLPRPPRPPLQSWLWLKAIEKMQIIDGLYKSFVVFVRKQAAPGTVPAPVKEWLDLAESVLMDPKTSAAQAVRKLHELLQHGDMFRSILQEEHPDLCELQLSPHQLIYDTYNTISLTEIKGYAMMQFSWMLLRIYGKGNFTQEASLTRQRYGERTAQTAAAARAALSVAQRGLYRCDPPLHKEGETYAEVTRLLQGYVENEVDMNADGTCRDNCAYYTVAENHGCFKDLYCNKQKTCKGRILECSYIDSDMWICPARRDSNRRYEWIEYENGRTFGKVGSCTRGTTKFPSGGFLVALVVLALFLLYVPLRRRRLGLRPLLQSLGHNIRCEEQQVDSWWRWNLLHCSYCFCLCEDDAKLAERFFSMKESLSDVSKNKVVTGLRLVKLGRVFHLQISEGTLGERGAVTAGDWVPLQKFDPTEPGMRDGVDYHKLSYEKRAIDLDELDSPAGHVLTGVRFRMLGAHLHFEIRSTPFNYATGRLSPERSQWISNDNTDGAEQPRKRLDLVRPDIPTRSRTPLPVDSSHDQYVEFTHTDFEADAAQSTVPFVDIQPVIPMKGAGLASGAGIIHRGLPGSGGFIAVKLFTYDYSAHIQAEPPSSEFDDDTETTEFVPIVN